MKSLTRQYAIIPIAPQYHCSHMVSDISIYKAANYNTEIYDFISFLLIRNCHLHTNVLNVIKSAKKSFDIRLVKYQVRPLRNMSDNVYLSTLTRNDFVTAPLLFNYALNITKCVMCSAQYAMQYSSNGLHLFLSWSFGRVWEGVQKEN